MRGSGTSDSPYIVENKNDFLNIPSILANRSNPGVRIYFQLDNDIDLSDTSYSSFDLYNVSFDGRMFAIFGLTFNQSTTDNYALFKVVNNSEIKNLLIKFVNITARDAVASLAVQLQSSIVEKIGIYGCNITGRNTVGGLCAQLDNSTVKECFVENSVIQGQSTIGGLAGIVLGASTISQSYTRGQVKQTGTGQIVGGFVGWLKKTSTGPVNISFCFSDVDIQSNTTTDVRGFIGKIST